MVFNIVFNCLCITIFINQKQTRKEGVRKHANASFGVLFCIMCQHYTDLPDIKVLTKQAGGAVALAAYCSGGGGGGGGGGSSE